MFHRVLRLRNDGFAYCLTRVPGMMRLLYNKCEHPGKSSVLFLPMIDMNSGDKTCILSTLEYLCKLASKHNMPAVVTFDQPLYWKASEIVNAAPDDSLIRNVVLMLGSFHTFMNVLGAIGTLMDGSGLKDIMETVYGENAVVHMMSGKAVQRAFRGHLLVDQCLTCQIVAKIMEDDPDFHEQVEELERLYTLMESGECTLESLSKSGCIRRIDKTVSLKKDELAAASKTGALWVNYQKMLGIARTPLFNISKERSVFPIFCQSRARVNHVSGSSGIISITCSMC